MGELHNVVELADENIEAQDTPMEEEKKGVSSIQQVISELTAPIKKRKNGRAPMPYDEFVAKYELKL